MQIVSVNVSLPRQVEWQGSRVTTGIFKDPISGRVPLRTLNLAGDGQADLSVHGGRDKAVYAFPSEHYPDWEAQVGQRLSPGTFGENLTTVGLVENQVHIGDEFRVGTARLVITQPRMPCFKLGIRFGDPSIVKAFLEAGWPGVYFAVVEEGEVAARDTIERIHTDDRRVSVTDMFAMMLDKNAAADDLRRVLQVPALAQVWRREFELRVANLADRNM